MKTEFTKVEMYNLKGCYSKEELNKCSFMVKDNISIIEILDSEIPLKDKSWFIRNSIELTDLEKKEFAIGCALVVLPIYENKYPNVDAAAYAAYVDAAAAAYAADAAADAAAAAAAADAGYKDKLLSFFKEFVS